MGINNILKNTMGRFFKSGSPAQGRSRSPLASLFKGINDDRFSDTQDPLVAEQYATEELSDFLKLYDTHPWVYICANAIATAAASVRFEIKSKAKTVEPDEVGQFMVKPNPHMTWFDLIEVTFLHLELSGNCYWEIIRGPENDGKVEVIFPMRPDRMKIVPDAKKKVDHYEYQIDGKTVNKYKPEEILHLKYNGAQDEFYGTPPISSGKNDVTLDFYMTKWNKKFFSEGAEPASVLETDQVLPDTVWNRILTLWNKRHKGSDKSHGVAILEGGLKWKQVTSKHADMQYLDGKKATRDVVLAIMRVPPVIVGLVDGVTYANSKDQKKVFWQHNIIPKLIRLQAAINAHLMPEGFQIEFVTKMIDSIIEDDEVKSRINQANISHGILTINEVRKLHYNLPPVKWGDVFWCPVGLAPVDGPEPPVPAPAEHPPGEGATDEMSTGQKSPTQAPGPRKRPPESARARDVETEKRELEDIRKADPDPTDRNAVADYHVWNVWKASAGPDDRFMRAQFENWFKQQGEEVLSRIERNWPIKKAENDPVDFDVEYFMADLADDDEKLRALIVPMASRMIRKYGSQLMLEIGSSKRFDIQNQAVQKFLSQHAADRVRHINQTTRDLLRKNLSEAFAAREGVKEVITRMKNVFEGPLAHFRARRIARTELVTLTNNARHEAARQDGTVQQKRWISEQLPSTRQEKNGANHMLMHGVIKAFDEKFEAPNRSGGVDLMDCPGDLNASGENVCGCLCIVGYFHGNEEFADIILGEDLEKHEVKKQGKSLPDGLIDDLTRALRKDEDKEDDK
jgi:HK97 family phage portal protein